MYKYHSLSAGERLLSAAHTLGAAKGTRSARAWSGHPGPWLLIYEERGLVGTPAAAERLMTGQITKRKRMPEESIWEKPAGPVSPTVWQWVLGARGWERSPDLDHQLQRPQRRLWTVSKLGTDVQVEVTGGSKLRMSQGLSSLLRRKEWSLTLRSSFAALNKSLTSLTGSSVLYKVEAVITVL